MTDISHNPMLSRAFPIPFEQIETAHVEPAIRHALASAEQELEALISQDAAPTYDNTVKALYILGEKLTRVSMLAGHLMSVKQSPELRESFNKMLPEISAFQSRLSLNEGLWQRIKTLDTSTLTPLQQRDVELQRRNFRRAGADLPAEKKAEVERITVLLAQKQNDFSNHVLDATNAFELLLTEADLDGLPDSAKAQARANAQSKELDGYRFTLQYPSLLPFLRHSTRRDLREQMYRAFGSRATEGELDNRPLVREILALRQELATLHGKENFADYQLEPRMAKDAQTVISFLEELSDKTQPYFEKENAELIAFAKDKLNIEDIQPWDMYYVNEQMRQQNYALDEEILRPYFPMEQVMQGMFDIFGGLFGLQFIQSEAPTWHEDVRFYEVRNLEGTHLGSFYADWFPREEKRGGAWMNYLIGAQKQDDGSLSPHLGLICGNFTPPQGDKPALLSHYEVETTFHEFGHLLHQLTSQVPIAALAGVRVPWDFVELPSQIMENWCWDYEALSKFAKHYQTGEVLPRELFAKMQAARTFDGAQAQMRQLSFGYSDIMLHSRYHPEQDGDAFAYESALRARYHLRPDFVNPHLMASFSHVFSGAYAAGYYSYKWAEVLDADAFSRFQAEGIFNPEVGQAYLETILSQGHSHDPEVLYRNFMGRDPQPDALLRRNLGLDKVNA